MIDVLAQDVVYVPGVGPRRKEILSKELNINTFGDLLEYYPYKYVDRSRIYASSELTADMPFVQLKGKILSFERFENGRRQRLVGHFSDGQGRIVDLTWFSRVQQITKNLQTDTEYIVFGKPTTKST